MSPDRCLLSSSSAFHIIILQFPNHSIDLDYLPQAISKMQIAFKDKAWTDEKAEHTREYVSILRRSATP